MGACPGDHLSLLVSEAHRSPDNKAAVFLVVFDTVQLDHERNVALYHWTQYQSFLFFELLASTTNLGVGL